MNLSFTTEYYPSFDELTDEQVAEARAKVVASLQPVLPDVDLSPGTPTGDFVVTPLAAYRATAEEANSRLMSDLDLSNVADGLIYSCAFVQAYLGNFGVYDVENFRATGLVRLTFTTPAARQIPRTIRFRFNTTDDWTLKVADPTITDVTILPAGSAHNGAPDTYVLAQTTSNTWAVDLPVEGVLSAPIPAGQSGTSTEVNTELVGISSAITFLSGLPSASLSALARMARKVSYSLTAGSRSTTRSLVYRNWPEANMVSPIVPGDREMQRVAAGSTMALQAPSVDLYFRSSRDMQRESHSVRLDYVQPEAGGSKVFRGVLPLLHRPSLVLGVEWSGTTTESFVISHRIFSKSGRADLYGRLHCGTRYETLYAEVVPVVNGLLVPLIPLSEDENGNQYAIFTVTYDADPLLETVSSLLESPDYRPAGVDVLVKSGPLMLVDSMEIVYTKKQGVKTTLSTAREKITEYFRTVGHPDVFRTTEIHDIVRNAGAEKVVAVTASGRLLASPAGRLFRSTLTDPGGEQLTADWTAESDVMPVTVLTTLAAIANPDVIEDGEISPGGPADAWAATERTVRYAIEPGNIQFVETS